MTEKVTVFQLFPFKSLIVWGQIRENVLKNEYAKHVGYKQFVLFHHN